MKFDDNNDVHIIVRRSISYVQLGLLLSSFQVQSSAHNLFEQNLKNKTKKKQTLHVWNDAIPKN